MASQIFAPRKQRTRHHVIADLGVHYVVGFILEEGHTAQPLDSDYVYDLTMCTFDEHGYAEPGMDFFQMKAAESLQGVGSTRFAARKRARRLSACTCRSVKQSAAGR
jgi:hypothetical protein